MEVDIQYTFLSIEWSMMNPQESASTEFDLFRRAYHDGDETALTQVYITYSVVLAARARRHPAFQQSCQDAAGFAHTALGNFYHAVKGEKFLQKFSVLPQVMAYLYCCVHTAIMKDVRDNKASELPVDFPSTTPEHEPSELLAVIDDLLPTPEDQLLARLRFALEMKPAEICHYYPHLWQTARDVSTALQRIRRRLRTSPKLCAMVGVAVGADETVPGDD
jgi:hypothetical protein